MGCRVALLLLVASAGTACDDSSPFADLQPTWSGEIVDIAVDDDIRVCAGDLAALDAHARFVAEAIDAPADRRALYLWTHQERVSELCWFGAGCALPDGGVGSSLAIGFHEVVHVLAAYMGRSKTLWEEGLATAFQPHAVYKGEHHPVAMLELGAERISYGQAAHLMRWLWPEHRAEILDVYAATRWNDSNAHAASVFDNEMGASLLELGDRYREESSDVLFSLRNADQQPLPWQQGMWKHSLAFDCDADHTLSDPVGLRRAEYIAIAQPGIYEFAVTSGSLEVVTPYGEAEFTSWSYGTPRLTIELDAGTYRVEVLVPGDGPFDVELSARPSLIAQPTTPDDE